MELAITSVFPTLLLLLCLLLLLRKLAIQKLYFSEAVVYLIDIFVELELYKSDPLTEWNMYV